ncbi:sialidase family protein [Hyphococcus luteus]|uniref:Sialidase domain-containing protein n=1 Tax=Hyphococcus luteus TaxID=2058213 RepID=A0A2S7K1P2_9PROT|nr:sialidase family protein [Marinicaulis flavus]PQA86348.1 hypothetical protein CW354_18590 [Marinicaulis flavus]
MIERRDVLISGLGATALASCATRAPAVRRDASINERFSAPREDTTVKHGVVYRNENEFCGWPFYCGFWKTADGSLLASFKRIPTEYNAYDDVDHNNLTKNRGKLWTIRSRDNGESWDPSTFQAVFDMNIREENDLPGGGAADRSDEAPLDFFSRDTLIMGGGIPRLFSPGGEAWMRASTDGGRTWRRPMLIPKYDLPSLTAFGSSMYATREDGVHILGLNTGAPEALSPRPLVYHSSDGKNWRFLSFVTEERPPSPFYPGGSPFAPAPHFYPRVTILEGGHMLASLRYQRDPRNVIWTEIHESKDGGRTWNYLSRVNDWGAPGDLVPMRDGRVVCVYGYRIAPQGIRYRVSEDKGKTWGPEMILRDDGGSWDLGYPRVIEVEPGELMTIYYMNLKSDPVQVNGGVRHIAWTKFHP